MRVKAIIGTKEEERTCPQELIINLRLEMCPEPKACLTDNLSDTLDYEQLKDRIVNLVKGSDYFLLERLAEVIMKMVLEEPMIIKARVEIDKPSALAECDSVSIISVGTKNN